MGIHDGHREHMRTRFRSGGLDHFADHEVLELLLYYAIARIDTNEIAHRLIDRYGSLQGVFDAPIEDLQRVEGIGVAAATLLQLFPAVTRKVEQGKQKQATIINKTEVAGKYLLSCFEGAKIELIYLVCLDVKGKVLATKRLAEGEIGSAELSVRKLVEYALLTGASSVILSHNHPSGVALPSDQDYITTARVANALQTIGVHLLDHIIVADGDYVSMADSGYLQSL